MRIRIHVKYLSVESVGFYKLHLRCKLMDASKMIDIEFRTEIVQRLQFRLTFKNSKYNQMSLCYVHF